MHDVAIIGGGPVGSHLAFRLAGLGYDVAVFEQKADAKGTVCCTGIVSRECASFLDISKDLIFREASGARFYSPSGKLLDLRRNESLACIIDRPGLNDSLAKRAQKAGAKYVFSCSIKALESKNDKARITAADGEIHEARCAVTAGGFSPKLLEDAGMGEIDDFVMGAQAEVESNIDGIEVYFGREIAPGFFGWLVPTRNKRALVGLMSRKNPPLYLKKIMASLLASGKIKSIDAEIHVRGIPLKTLPRTFGDRLLAVGSAAGQVKPTTGGGIYYGLLCADIAANTLDQAFKKNDFSSKFLAKYDRAWKRKLGRELRIGYWARKFYENLNDNQLDRIFDIVKSKGIDDAFLKMDDLSFDWHGNIVLRLIKERSLSKTIGAIKIPFLRNGKESKQAG